MNDTWQKALELNAKFSALEKSYANAAAIAARQARVMGCAPEIMKMASGTSIRMAAAQTANTIHMNSSFLQSFRESTKIVAMHQQIIKPLCINLNAIFAAMASLSSIASAYDGVMQNWTTLWEKQQIIKDPNRRNRLRRRYLKWALYGWTCHPNIDFFINHPSRLSKKIADKIAVDAIDKFGIADLLADVYEFVPAKRRTDFEETVFAFEHQKYKSCAMLLFALIEGELIVHQKKYDADGHEIKRKLASGAAKNIRKEIKKSSTAKAVKNIFPQHLYRGESTCAALGDFFAHAEDFRKEKERKTINRNFVLHGMLLRQVDKKDCLQLYLLYYNILDMFNFFTDICKDCDELWLPSDKSDTDTVNSGEEDSE